jgi:hypothetical protein
MSRSAQRHQIPTILSMARDARHDMFSAFGKSAFRAKQKVI